MPTLRWQPRFIKAYWPWSWFLRRNEFWAIPMPWRTVYCLPEHIDDWIMRGHELVHFEQMERDGTVVFCVRYLWLALKHGYHNNPYEVEAYARFGHHMRWENHGKH
jgi:hypothetical protein